MDVPAEPDSSVPSSSRRRLLAVGTTVATAGLAGCFGFRGPSVSERSSRSIPVDDVERVTVRNRSGDVRVDPGPTDAEGIELEVLKRGLSQRTIDRIEVVDATEDGALRIETEYPDRLSDVAVDLAVRLPPGIPLESARTGNGDVTVRDVAGDATVASANGDALAVGVDGFVTVESANGDAVARGTTGVAAGRTANGDVDVEVFAVRDGAEFTNANGDVDVGVGPALDAAVVLAVGNGEIEVDAELEVTESSRNRVVGRLGDGGPRLRASSGNGDVRLYGL